MGTPSIEFVGVPCGHHGPYTFYKAFKYGMNGHYEILSLGEFFFVKILPDSPVCMAELQLLWEDKNNECQFLSSVRLYFLPENTPEGRLPHHGKDEVLAENDKIVMKIEDLLKWIVVDDKETSNWKVGTKGVVLSKDVKNDGQTSNDLAELFAANNCGLELQDVKKDKDTMSSSGNCKCGVKILSYSQYCRYVSMMRRVENLTDVWLRNALVSAMGGFSADDPNCRIVFCRDTFEHDDLLEHEFRQDHLAPNLKGRPRKKKKREFGQDSDSNGSEYSMEKYSPDKIKNNSNHLIGRDMKCKRTILRPNRDLVTVQEGSFLRELHQFMQGRNTPIDRIPSLGFKQLDLYQFYSLAQKLGGYDVLTEKRLWKQLYDKLGGNPGNTSAATCTRRHYEKLLLAFERYKRGKPIPKPGHTKFKQKAVISAGTNKDAKPHPEVKHSPAEANHKIPMTTISASMRKTVRTQLANRQQAKAVKDGDSQSKSILQEQPTNKINDHLEPPVLKPVTKLKENDSPHRAPILRPSITKPSTSKDVTVPPNVTVTDFIKREPPPPNVTVTDFIKREPPPPNVTVTDFIKREPPPSNVMVTDFVKQESVGAVPSESQSIMSPLIAKKGEPSTAQPPSPLLIPITALPIVRPGQVGHLEWIQTEHGLQPIVKLEGGILTAHIQQQVQIQPQPPAHSQSQSQPQSQSQSQSQSQPHSQSQPQPHPQPQSQPQPHPQSQSQSQPQSQPQSVKSVTATEAKALTSKHMSGKSSNGRPSVIQHTAAKACFSPPLPSSLPHIYGHIPSGGQKRLYPFSAHGAPQNFPSPPAAHSSHPPIPLPVHNARLEAKRPRTVVEQPAAHSNLSPRLKGFVEAQKCERMHAEQATDLSYKTEAQNSNRGADFSVPPKPIDDAPLDLSTHKRSRDAHSPTSGSRTLIPGGAVQLNSPSPSHARSPGITRPPAGIPRFQGSVASLPPPTGMKPKDQSKDSKTSSSVGNISLKETSPIPGVQIHPAFPQFPGARMVHPSMLQQHMAPHMLYEAPVGGVTPVTTSQYPTQSPSSTTPTGPPRNPFPPSQRFIIPPGVQLYQRPMYLPVQPK